MKASSIQSSSLYGLESSDTDVESDVSIHLIIAEREFHLKNEECDELCCRRSSNFPRAVAMAFSLGGAVSFGALIVFLSGSRYIRGIPCFRVSKVSNLKVMVLHNGENEYGFVTLSVANNARGDVFHSESLL